MRAKRTRALQAVCVAAAIAGAARAEPQKLALPDDPALALRPGSGADIVEATCGACHSLDYLTTQPPGKGRAFWEKAVRKMIDAYGAKVSEPDAAAIVDYLARTY